MATNKKHTDSKKYNKALTFEDRLSLDKIITTNRDNDGSFKLLLNNVGDMLEKDPSTLSKEVKNRRSNIQTKTYSYAGSYCYQCAKNRTCTKINEVRKFQLKCIDFEQLICKYLKKFPWVCNGCCKLVGNINKHTYLYVCLFIDFSLLKLTLVHILHHLFSLYYHHKYFL